MVAQQYAHRITLVITEWAPVAHLYRLITSLLAIVSALIAEQQDADGKATMQLQVGFQARMT